MNVFEMGAIAEMISRTEMGGFRRSMEKWLTFLRVG
jgi:hypothetical protein